MGVRRGRENKGKQKKGRDMQRHSSRKERQRKKKTISLLLLLGNCFGSCGGLHQLEKPCAPFWLLRTIEHS